MVSHHKITNYVTTQKAGLEDPPCHSFLSFLSSSHEHYSLYESALNKCQSKDTMREKSDDYIIFCFLWFWFLSILRFIII